MGSASGDNDTSTDGGNNNNSNSNNLSYQSFNSTSSSNHYNQQQHQQLSSNKNNDSNEFGYSTTTTNNNSNKKGSSVDSHPYARGSVIEVLHSFIPESERLSALAAAEEAAIVEGSMKDVKPSSLPISRKLSRHKHTTSKSDDNDAIENNISAKEEIDVEDNGDDDSSSDEEEDGDKPPPMTPRLCDIIDRSLMTVSNANIISYNSDSSAAADQQPSKEWKYYVHYRDFNRRMDEWIPLNRIISPPSVGGAKARALASAALKKKKELKQREKEEKARKEFELQMQKMGDSASKKSGTGRMMRSNSCSEGSVGGLNAASFSGRDRSGMTMMMKEAADLHRSNSISMFADEHNNHQDNMDASSRVTRRQKRRRASTICEGSPDGTAVSAWDMSSSINSGGFPNDVNSSSMNNNLVATVPAEELDEHEGLDEASLREHEEVTKVKNVAFIEIGPYKMETWYFSPIPKELLVSGSNNGGYLDVLYICEFSLNFFARKIELRRFQSKPGLERHPPGNEIYRNGNLSMFEIDGNEERFYCQNLCYIAKLFLDHKTLYYDVDPFLFYVMCEVDACGFHPVGYYSKEKYSDVGYNLACILTFPSHQRKGYGRFLIAFSYELTKKEEKVGSPEKPMSDLGQQAYKPYWTSTIVEFLLTTLHNKDQQQLQQSVANKNIANDHGHVEQSSNNYQSNTNDNTTACETTSTATAALILQQQQQPTTKIASSAVSMSIMDIAKQTSIMAEDIIFSLNQLGILKFINGVYFVNASKTVLEALKRKHPVKEPRVDPTKLHWTPFLTDVKRDKFSLHSKKSNVVEENYDADNVTSIGAIGGI